MQTKVQAANAKFVDENLNKLEEYAQEFANTNLPSGNYKNNNAEWRAFLEKWAKVMKTAMETDVSWNGPARDYIALYRKITGKK